MSTNTTTKNPTPRLTRIVAFAGCALVLGAGALGLWATVDRNWEQAWKDRIRVETPLGSEKIYVLSWIDRNCEFLPHVDAVCDDMLNHIPIVDLAGVQESAVSSYLVITVRRNDLAAGDRDHMRVYYFFDANDKVVGHYYLPFHELARFEHAYQLLASR